MPKKNKPERPTLLRLIQAAAKADKLNPRQLALRSGISYRAAYQIMHDRGIPSLVTVERVLTALQPHVLKGLDNIAEILKP